MAGSLALSSDSTWSHAALSAVYTNGVGTIENKENLECRALVHIDDINLIAEDVDSSPFPMPVLYMNGYVAAVAGDFGYGIDHLVFVNPEAGFAAEDSDGPSYVNRPPDIRFRYQFTPNQLAELAMKGLWQPDFDIAPSIMTNNEYEIPIRCDVKTITPQTEADIPVNIVSIKGSGCVHTSSKESGYVLSNYFQPAPSMENEANLVIRMDKSAELDEIVEVNLSNMLFSDVFEAEATEATPTVERVEASREAVVEEETDELSEQLFGNEDSQLVSEVLDRFTPSETEDVAEEELVEEEDAYSELFEDDSDASRLEVISGEEIETSPDDEFADFFGIGKEQTEDNVDEDIVAENEKQYKRKNAAKQNYRSELEQDILEQANDLERKAALEKADIGTFVK